MTTVKQVLGIDVSQDELVVCLGKMQDDWQPEQVAAKTFENSKKGFLDLDKWIGKYAEPAVPVHYVMEATGVYHESLAYWLADNQQTLSIVLPNKISNYARSLDVKTVTDKTAAYAIMLFGLERKLDHWKKPHPVYKMMRQLTRERSQLIVERTALKNQLHAEQSESEPLKSSIERLKKRIALLDKQQASIMEEIDALIASDAEIKKLIRLICSLPGIGKLTAAIILCETNGFELIKNKRQLTSYAGLDVKEKQSGTSIKGKPRISKRGNRNLRKAMYMPALSAIRSDKRFKAIFARIVARHGIKMKAGVAIQRKLLEMTFIIFKKGQPYDKAYLQNQLLDVH